MAHVEPCKAHARIEQRHNSVDFRACRPEGASDLGLSLHEVNLLKDLLLTVAAKVILALFIVMHLTCIRLIIQTGGALLSVVLH